MLQNPAAATFLLVFFFLFQGNMLNETIECSFMKHMNNHFHFLAYLYPTLIVFDFTLRYILLGYSKKEICAWRGDNVVWGCWNSKL